MPATSNNLIHNKIVTKRPIKFIIALAVVFTVSLGVLLYFAISWRENFIVTIAVLGMCGLFVILSGFMLMYVSMTYVEINNSKLTAHHIFYKKTLPVKKMDYYTEKDGLYEVYCDDHLFCSFDMNDPSSGKIVEVLEKHGIKYRQKR